MWQNGLFAVVSFITSQKLITAEHYTTQHLDRAKRDNWWACLPGDLEKIHQHKNGDIYLAEEYFYIKLSLFIRHIYFYINLPNFALFT